MASRNFTIIYMGVVTMKLFGWTLVKTKTISLAIFTMEEQDYEIDTLRMHIDNLLHEQEPTTTDYDNVIFIGDCIDQGRI